MLGGYIAGNIAYESKFLLKTESSKLLKFIYFFCIINYFYRCFTININII
jgi:hypothetical protein